MWYYLCGENKGADQLHGYREADLRLYFRICRLLVFPCSSSYVIVVRDSDRVVMKGNYRKQVILHKNMLMGAMALVVERQIPISRGPEF